MFHITFIIYGDINQTSGGYYYDRELVRALKQKGHSVKVCDARSIEEKHNRPDLYIIDELCHPDFYRTSHFRSLKTGVPVAGMIHHLAADEDLSIMNRFRHLRMEKGFLKHLDFAIFNSLSTKSSAINTGGYKGSLEIAVPGRTTTKYESKGDKEKNSPLSLLFIGNLIPRKGLHHVIKHLSNCDGIPFKFNIAGNDSIDPAYTQELKKLIRLYDLDDKIRITGPISEEEKRNMLAESDIFLMLSSHEGYGIAYIEAMGYGTIPVAGTSGGAGEIIYHGENGYLIEPEDGIQLKQILSSLFENQELKTKLSKEALCTWEKHPIWDETFNNLIRKMEELILSFKG